MKILHIPFTYFPDPSGGTEIYVLGLSHHLRELGFESVIAAPSLCNDVYQYDDINVYRYFTKPDVSNKRELYQIGDEDSAREFGEILGKVEPDLVNFHAHTRGVSLLHVREASKRNIKSVFTYHTPTVSCPRGTMMQWGNDPCDGVPDSGKCTACLLSVHAIPRWALVAFGVVSKYAPMTDANSKLAQLIQLRNLVELRQDTTRALFSEVDHVIAVCDWVKEVILRWGIDDSRVSLVRQGLNPQNTDPGHLEQKTMVRSDGVLRIVFFGRVDSTKGLEWPIKALKSIEREIEFHIFGIAQDDPYVEYLKKLSEHLGNIHWMDPIPANSVVSAMRDYDAVIIPSVWLETGPLVAYEAEAAGVPVIGHAIGGLLELVPEFCSGVLIDRNITAWANVLETFSLTKYKTRKARYMKQVAREVAQVYQQVLQKNNI